MSDRMRGRRHAPRRLARGPEDVCTWRERRLRAAGFEASLAAAVSADCRYDLHAILELTDRGCAPALAARIMAPLDPAPTP